MIGLDRASIDRLLPAVPGSADWDDVLGRAHAGRSRRQVLVVLAIVLFVAVVSASALAMRALFGDRGFVGFPPAGAIASAPEHGTVALRARGRCPGAAAFCFVWVYRDGRLIWIRDPGGLPYGANEHTTGLLEQRLAPSGLKLLRSAFISTGACELTRAKSVDCFPPYPGPAPFPAIRHPGWRDATWGLPANAWRDPKVRAFVPARYAACFEESDGGGLWREVDAPRLLILLPPPAARLLRGRDAQPPSWFSETPICFALATKEARTFAGILDRAGGRRPRDAKYVLHYQLPAPGGVFVEIAFAPMLPNGEWVITGGG